LLLGLALAAASRAQSVNLAVDATQVVRIVDERVFGLNAVMWDPQTASAQTISLLQAAGLRVFRIPGGSASDAYDWSTNKGYASAGVLNTWTWSAGFDKFSQLIVGVNSQAFATVNYGSGTPEQAAAWVAYANASSTLLGTPSDVNLGVDFAGVDWKTAGYWSSLRAAAPLATDDSRNFLRVSRASAIGIKYWEIGNECYGSWETDYHGTSWDASYHGAKWDPVTYATVAKDYIARMKAVDPTIKIGVVAQVGEDNLDSQSPVHNVSNPRTSVTHHGWTPVMLTTLRNLGTAPDFLIYHRYEQTPLHDTTLANAESDATLLQKAGTWPNDAADLRHQLSDYLGAAGTGVEINVTENNSVYAYPGKQTTSVVNGLYLADSIGNVLQTEFNSLVWWDLRNGQDNANNNNNALYGWRNYGDYGALSTPSSFGSSTYYDPYPTYYIMKLLSHFARGGDTVVRATSNSTLVSGFAARRVDGSLSILVINKSPGTTLTANISLAGFIPQATAAAYAYGIPQDEAARAGSGSTDIATSSLSNASAAFTVSCAPYSARVFSLQAAVSSAPSISIQPGSQTATAGQNAGFSVIANGSPAPDFRWQRQVSGSSTWSNLSDTATYTGTGTATLTVNSVTAAMNGDSFQCVISNAIGSVTTSPATLVVNTPLIVSTLAGQAGTSGGTDGTGTAARFSSPSDVAVDNAGNVFVADTGNHTVRKITPAGVVVTLVGEVGVSGSSDGSGAARFNHPTGIAVDGSGVVYVADTDNNSIRKVTTTGAVFTLAGHAGTTGSADGTGTAATFNSPSGIAVDGTGNLFVADSLNHTIRKVTPAGAVTTIAGTAGSSGAVDGTGSAARFHGPQGLVLDSSGNLYVADTNNSTIRKIVTATGAVTTLTGQAGNPGSTDGSSSQARFYYPSGVAVDGTGNLYVADTDNDSLRQISSTGAVSTIAGAAGTSGSADGVGLAARFYFPTGITADGSGNIYVADTNNHTIRVGGFPTAPIITASPSSQTVTAGANVQFSVTVTGRPAPTYQWSFNGTAISGATSATLSLTNVQTSSAGTYTVGVTNSSGSVTSSQATLTVNAASSGSSGGGGGGGAMETWFVAVLALLWAARQLARSDPGPASACAKIIID
jgi:hypothetical protein